MSKSSAGKSSDVQTVLDSALGVSLITVNPEGVITGFSRGSERMLGYGAQELIGKESPLLFHDPTEVAQRSRELSELLGRQVSGFEVFVASVGEQDVEEQEWTYIRKDGSRLTVSLSVSRLFDSHGALRGYLGSAVDITRSRKAEEALLQEKHFFDQLINSLPGIFYLYDASLHLKKWNRNHETLLGYSAAEMNGKYLGDWHASREGRDLAVAASKGIIEQGIQLDAVESSLRHKSGKEVPFLLTGVRVDSPEGPMLAGVGIDLTERKRLEEQLRQSQKLESIGLLAGGIAHDFNNILTTIMGNIDLGRSAAPPHSPLLRFLDNTMRAAESAGKLTRQLLAFSRKEVIAPRIIDVNMVLDHMEGMLQRLIGEHVRLQIRATPDLWLTRMDPGQLEQILLNLSVNARDAMPDGGSLTLETGNIVTAEVQRTSHFELPAGEYATVIVKDSGEGIPEEVMPHLFEPFYTTKGMGRGTGLGLAMVFGALKQNGGYIDVHSQQGLGSTFTMYLPRVQGTVEELASDRQTTVVAGGSETIILAEDDPELRTVSVEYLEGLGYRVIGCPDGKSALDASIAAGTVHLLITDVIMPGMNGKDLAERMLTFHKNMKVLYSSGYTADIIDRHGMLDAGVNFLPKPYSLAELAGRIRDTLDLR